MEHINKGKAVGNDNLVDARLRNRLGILGI